MSGCEDLKGKLQRHLEKESREGQSGSGLLRDVKQEAAKAGVC